MKIAKHAVVTMNYTLKDDEGNVIDSSQGGDPLTYLHGVGQIISGLEQCMEGRTIGDKFDVRIDPAEGYGVHDSGLIRTVNKDNFDAEGDLAVGMQFHARSPEGVMVFRITDIAGDEVTIDGNHPLAGVHLNFDVTIEAVRHATAEELAHGHAHGEHGHSHD